ncbi:hypothetical protein BH753_gp010 [Bacillus phage Shbh1]|uniref:Uncharacterized protein n=1 Tax=Bacillus phage Shbh1 TaxID=1796992 RepID=A0A142F135_9CAUD|nr:hypothetical protein BH753_gp010 [Bacillus phage Shbh1]AMQ66492.1 hypothetical protein [Bacillus phage Shbh1]
MDLRKAMEIVVRDGLQNYGGNICFEIPQEKIQEIVNSVTNNDNFLIRFNEVFEELLNEYLEDHGDEFDIYEED